MRVNEENGEIQSTDGFSNDDDMAGSNEWNYKIKCGARPAYSDKHISGRDLLFLKKWWSRGNPAQKVFK